MSSSKRKKALIAVPLLLLLGLGIGVYRNTNIEQNEVESREEAEAERPLPVAVQSSGSQTLERVDSSSMPAVTESSQPTQEITYEELIRSDIERSSDLPIGVSFKVTLGLLEDLNDENPSYALYHLQHEMGFDPSGDDPTSEELLERLLEVRQTIVRETRQENRRLGCSFGVPVATGEQVYPILEAMDDTEEIVAKRHLDLLAKELDSDTAKRLERWLDDQKTNITQVKYNYKDYYKITGKNADAKLASVCINLTEGL